MAPVIKALRASERVRVQVLVTAQHRELLDDAMGFFGLKADRDLDAMRPDQTVTALAGGLLEPVAEVLREWRPALVLVQGDTTTVLSVALAGAFLQIPVGHVEAGLRTGDPSSPFPEELNRRLVAQVASLHFAPTELAARNLAREGVPASAVQVTGNPVVDALEWARPRLKPEEWRSGGSGKLVLVTLHRRENRGEQLSGLLAGLSRLVARGGVHLLCPVHPNPRVAEPIRAALGGLDGVRLVEPMSYGSFLSAMAAADLVISDSGGVQEEACSLRVPVLVPRAATERPEAVDAGWVELVGADPTVLVAAAERVLGATGPTARANQAEGWTPFGDGAAGQRIAEEVRDFLGTIKNSGRPA